MNFVYDNLIFEQYALKRPKWSWNIYFTLSFLKPFWIIIRIENTRNDRLYSIMIVRKVSEKTIQSWQGIRTSQWWACCPIYWIGKAKLLLLSIRTVVEVHFLKQSHSRSLPSESFIAKGWATIVLNILLLFQENRGVVLLKSRQWWYCRETFNISLNFSIVQWLLRQHSRKSLPLVNRSIGFADLRKECPFYKGLEELDESFLVLLHYYGR